MSYDSLKLILVSPDDRTGTAKTLFAHAVEGIIRSESTLVLMEEILSHLKSEIIPMSML